MDNNKKRKIQIKTFKKESEYDKLFSSIDSNSLELYAQMMRDRYGDNDLDDQMRLSLRQWSLFLRGKPQNEIGQGIRIGFFEVSFFYEKQKR